MKLKCREGRVATKTLAIEQDKNEHHMKLVHPNSDAIDNKNLERGNENYPCGSKNGVQANLAQKAMYKSA